MIEKSTLYLQQMRRAVQALLNFDDYFVEEITVKSNPDYKPKDKVSGESSISFEIKQKGSELFFMMPMTIEVNKTKKAFSAAPYYIYLKISGFFSFPEGTDEETIRKMIGLNGLVMLYGAARGVVAQVTANCPHGKFVLPSRNFVELVKAKTKAGTKRKTAREKAS